jgi:peptidoglycan-N-acetylglucosamine deacetylase
MELLAYNNGRRNENKVALTFDDGPNPFWTKKFLDVLDEFKVKANFFILGKWAEANKEIVEDTFKRGHLIGNHSYSHQQDGVGDFEKAEEIIYRIINEHTKFIRPPYNNTSLCSQYAPVLNKEVAVINNDIIPKDWCSQSKDILESVKRETKNGSIILLHDGSHREQQQETRPEEMYKVLPEIIKTLKEKFEIVRLDKMDFNNTMA